jgi:hypothetical protein
VQQRKGQTQQARKGCTCESVCNAAECLNVADQPQIN